VAVDKIRQPVKCRENQPFGHVRGWSDRKVRINDSTNHREVPKMSKYLDHPCQLYLVACFASERSWTSWNVELASSWCATRGCKGGIRAGDRCEERRCGSQWPVDLCERSSGFGWEMSVDSINEARTLTLAIRSHWRRVIITLSLKRPSLTPPTNGLFMIASYFR
jgi:hypothetical protein